MMDFRLLIPLFLGWLSGLLVNYLADVLPVTHALSHPICPECQKTFGWSDYLLLRNCRNCGKPRRFRIFIIQLAMTVLPVIFWIFPSRTLTFPLAFLLLVYLTVVLVIDIEHRLILHPVSIIGAVIGFGIGIFLRGKQTTTYGITSSLLGGIAGFGVMLVIYFLGQLFMKQITKKRGVASDEVALGFGDVNLAGILGLMLGWRAIFVCLFFAILFGGLVSLVIILRMLILKKYKSFTAIPYAPFLILSACYFLFF